MDKALEISSLKSHPSKSPSSVNSVKPPHLHLLGLGYLVSLIYVLFGIIGGPLYTWGLTSMIINPQNQLYDKEDYAFTILNLIEHMLAFPIGVFLFVGIWLKSSTTLKPVVLLAFIEVVLFFGEIGLMIYSGYTESNTDLILLGVKFAILSIASGNLSVVMMLKRVFKESYEEIVLPGVA